MCEGGFYVLIVSVCALFKYPNRKFTLLFLFCSFSYEWRARYTRT